MATSTHKVKATDNSVTNPADNPDSGTVANGGNISGSLFQAKSPMDLVRGSDNRLSNYGSQITATPTHLAISNSNGTIAFNPNTASRTSTNTGFVMRGGVGNNISGISSFNPIAVNGSDTGGRYTSIHKKLGNTQKGTWADRTFDVLSGTLAKGTGAGSAFTFKTTTNSASDATDDAASPTRAIPGEFVILQNFVDYDGTSTSGDGTSSENMMDYSAITG
jgi:hypothetical protein